MKIYIDGPIYLRLNAHQKTTKRKKDLISHSIQAQIKPLTRTSPYPVHNRATIMMTPLDIPSPFNKHRPQGKECNKVRSVQFMPTVFNNRYKITTGQKRKWYHTCQGKDGGGEGGYKQKKRKKRVMESKITCSIRFARRWITVNEGKEGLGSSRFVRYSASSSRSFECWTASFDVLHL